MSNLDLNNISNNFYTLLLSLHKHIFNPNQALKSSNIPPSHMKVLIYLTYSGPTTVSKTAKDLHISKPNMTPIIDKLVNENLIERSLDKNDRRVIILQTTEKCADFLKEAEDFLKSIIADKISNFTEEELYKLSHAVNDLLDICGKF